MYESFFGLKAKPFHLSPDPRFFFGSSGHKRVLAYLRYGINQGEGFIVVTGEVGTGKTTLVRTLLAELPERKNVVAAQLVSTHLESFDLLRAVAAAFGLSHDDESKSALLGRLEAFMRQQFEQGRQILLIVDEAQNLPMQSLEELRMLSNFQVGHKPLLQSFLLGQAEFRDKLQSPSLEQVRQRVIASYHLGPMNAEETRAYIDHRLYRAGWEGGEPLFGANAHEKIYGYTGGVPRRINSLCDRAMLVAYLEEVQQVDEHIVDKVIQELHEESFGSAQPSEARDQESVPVGGPVHMPASAERRLAELERRVNLLEDVVDKAQELFRALADYSDAHESGRTEPGPSVSRIRDKKVQ